MKENTTTVINLFMEDFVHTTIKAIGVAETLAVELGTPPPGRTTTGCVDQGGAMTITHPNCLVRCAHTMYNDNSEIVNTTSPKTS